VRARATIESRSSDVPVDLLVADGHKTPFRDHAFDLVLGQAILHHLDIEEALLEVRRILKPCGMAVFKEPLAHNPVFRLGRALTPFARTPDERPLTTEDWQLCASAFSHFRHYELDLLATFILPLTLVLPHVLQRELMRSLRPLDNWLLRRAPYLRKYARVTILVFG